MQSYQYTDGMNRLTSASEGANSSRTFGYDAFGNMWVTGATGVPADSFTPVTQSWIDAQKNRLTNAGLGVAYDAGGNGNLTAMGGYAWSYDAENRLAWSTILGARSDYSYDGDGRRVTKSTGGVTTTDVYDAAGQRAAEYTTPAPAAVWARSYLTVDHLGSTRVVGDETGAVRSRHDYLPFGEEIPAGIAGRATLFPASGLGINDGVAQKLR